MSIDFKALNEKVDLKGLQEDIKEVKENGGTGDFKEVPTGSTYEVGLEKMEMGLSKKGDPMVIIWWNILEGEFKNSKIFQYQVITRGFQIHIINEFLRSLGTSIEVEFEDYEQYNDLLLDIAEEIEAEGLEYALAYGQNSKGFNTYKIEEIFES